MPKSNVSVILETLQPQASPRPILPLVPGFAELAEENFLTPATVKSATPRLLKKYKPAQQDPIFLRQEPKPDSVIVLAMWKKHPPAPETSIPLKRESKKLDALAEKCVTPPVSLSNQPVTQRFWADMTNLKANLNSNSLSITDDQTEADVNGLSNPTVTTTITTT